MPISTPHLRRVASACLLALAGAALYACGDDDNAASADTERASVTFTATDTSLTVPDEVPSGFIDITLDTEPGEVGHHLFVARLNDGVTLADVEVAPDEEFFSLVTIKGGTSGVPSGDSARMTLQLEPGNHFVIDNPQLPEPVVRPFTVVEADDDGRRPDDEGVVGLGPDMKIDLPDDFDGTGVWQFVNDDSELAHEALVVRLTDGSTFQDLLDWAQTQSGPPPFEDGFAGMGALGPGERAWLDLEPSEPGDYAMICFVPGENGPHFMEGMVVPFTVDG